MSKSMIRIISLMFAILVLAVSLSACKGNDKPAEESSESTQQKAESGTESETESGADSEADPNPEAVEDLALVVDMICNYTIIRPEIMGDKLQKEVLDVKRAIGELTKVTPKISEDWLNPYTGQQPEELEIIIGNCNREETQRILAGLKYNDWAVEIVGKKLVIAGHSEETTLKAIAYFMRILDNAEEGQDFSFLVSDCHTERAVYRLDDITISGGWMAGRSVKEYRIVIPNLCSAAEKNAANELAEYIASLTGYTIDVVKDSTKETAREILIGKTNRQASANVHHSLRYHDSELRIDDGKIVALGYLPENTVKMCDKLIEIISAKAAKSKSITLADEDSVADKREYQANGLFINGNNIRIYTIVYPEGNELCSVVANSLKKAIIEKMGISIDVVSDKNVKNTEKEILIGNTNRTAEGGEAAYLIESFSGEGNEGYLATSAKYVIIGGGDEGGFGKAIGQFMQKIFPDGPEGTGSINTEISPLETFKAETEDVKVMSYNILTWPTQSRIEQIASIILDYAPDVIGMQEAQPSSIAALEKLIGDTYAYVTLERDKASAESTPIWYNKNKYNLIESGSGWLSETPNVMSKLKSSEYYRVYVYVVLENKETGARFVHVNTHLDFAAAQQAQVSILLAQTMHLAHMPMFYTADWNFTTGEAPYNMVQSSGFIDASIMTENTMSGATMVGGNGEIDFCFTSPLNTSVDSYRVINDHEFSETSSDHYPIFVELKIVK